MTESEWLALDDPEKMLEFLVDTGRATARKVRLFGSACCRCLWPLLADQRSRNAVEASEELAEKKTKAVKGRTIKGLAQEAIDASWNYLDDPVAEWAATAAYMVLSQDEMVLRLTCKYAVQALAGEPRRAGGATPKQLKSWVARCKRRPQGLKGLDAGITVARILHDVFGNPFRPPPTINPAWLTRKSGSVRRLAEAAYRERALPGGTLGAARLAVLVDALEEAGCADGNLLGHLRSGQHVRGCWAVDAVLGLS